MNIRLHLKHYEVNWCLLLFLHFLTLASPFCLTLMLVMEVFGGVLSQIQADGSERVHVVRYGSHTLSKAERNYCVTSRELLAMVYFVEHFRPYLLERKFTLRTDHGALKWLQSFESPEGQMARWLESYRILILL